MNGTWYSFLHNPTARIGLSDCEVLKRRDESAPWKLSSGDQIKVSDSVIIKVFFLACDS